MHGKSAQALVTEALDELFGEIADLDALAKRVKPKAQKRAKKG